MPDAKADLGETYWFDIPELRATLGQMLMLEPEDFEEWVTGKHAADFVGRIDRILASVEERQGPFRDYRPSPRGGGVSGG